MTLSLRRTREAGSWVGRLGWSVGRTRIVSPLLAAPTAEAIVGQDGSVGRLGGQESHDPASRVRRRDRVTTTLVHNRQPARSSDVMGGAPVPLASRDPARRQRQRRPVRLNCHVTKVTGLVTEEALRHWTPYGLGENSATW